MKASGVKLSHVGVQNVLTAATNKRVAGMTPVRLALRAEGLSWAAAARRLGASVQSVQIAVWHHLAETGQLTTDVVEPLWRTRRQPPKWRWLGRPRGICSLLPRHAALSRERRPWRPARSSCLSDKLTLLRLDDSGDFPMTMRPVAQRLQKPSSPASIAPQLLAARDGVPGRKFFVFVSSISPRMRSIGSLGNIR